MKRQLLYRSLLAVGTALLVGCETTERIIQPSTSPEPVVDHQRGAFVPEPAFSGSWLLEEGRLLRDFDTALRATGLEVSADGHANVYFHDLRTGANACARAYLLYDGETMVLDLTRDRLLQYHQEATMYFPIVVYDEVSLGVADEDGRVALLSRQTSLPAEITCQTLPFVVTHTGLPQPHGGGDLEFYYGDLIYNSSSYQIERFDLATGTLLTPLQTADWNLVVATQELLFTNLWSYCWCGANLTIERNNLSVIYDSVDTDADLGEPTFLFAAAYVPSSARLWVHGSAYYQGQPIQAANSQFLVIDTTSEPDVLERKINFGRRLSGLCFDGVDLWAVAEVPTAAILQIDLNGQVLASYDVPDPDVIWNGLAFDGDGNLCAVGSDENNQGVIMMTNTVSAVSLAAAEGD